MPKPSMKRVLWILLGVLFGVPGVLLAGILLFHDSIAEEVMVRIMKSEFPVEGEVNGEFNFTLSLEPTAAMTDIRLFDQDTGEPLMEAGVFELTFDLRRALTGVTLITNAVLRDARIFLGEDETVFAALESDPERLILPVVQNAIFENVQVASITAPDLPLLTIDKLKLQEEVDGGLVLVDGAIIWAQSGVGIEGVLGGPTAALDPNVQFPIKATIQSPEFKLDLDGTIRDVVRGEDLSLDVRMESGRVADLARLAGLDIPDVGRLLLNAKLEGRVADPTITAFDLTIGGTERISLAASGRFEDPLLLQGLAATVNVNLSDQALMMTLAGDSGYPLTGLSASARVEVGEGLATVRDLVATLNFAGDVEVSGTGTVEGQGLVGLVNPEKLDVAVTLTSPTTAAADTILDLTLPELGPVRASAMLTSIDSKLALQDLNIVSGVDSTLSIEIDADIPDILREEVTKGVVFLATITTEDSAQLERLFDFPVPGIGPLTLTLDANPIFEDEEYVGDRYENIVATAGTPDGITVSASGRIGFVAVDKSPAASGIDLTFKAASPDTAQLSQFLEIEIPSLGKVEGSVRVSGDSQTAILSDIVVNGDLNGDLALGVQGRVGRVDLDTPLTYSEIELAVRANAPDTAKWAETLNVSLPVRGPLAAGATLTGTQDALNARDVSVEIGSDVPMALSLRGHADNFLDTKRIEASGEFQAVLAPLLTASFVEDLPDLGTLEGAFSVSGGDDRLNIVKFDLDASSLEGMHLSGTGAVIDLDGDISSELDIRLDVESIAALATVDPDKAMLKAPLTLDGRLALARNRTSFDGLTAIGETRIKTSLVGEFQAPRPTLRVRLDSAQINLSDFERQNVPDVEETREPPISVAALGQVAIPFNQLGRFDLDLEADFGPVVGEDFSLTGLDASYVVIDRRLAATTVANYDKGSLRVDFTVDASGEIPTFLVNASGDDMDVEGALRQLGWHPVLEGDLTLRVEVDSRGTSYVEATKNLNGTAAFAVEEGRIKIGNLERISSDRFQSQRASVEGSDWTELRCAVIRLEIENGLATTNGMVIATPNVVIGGGGQIDLRDDTVDVVLRPQREVNTRMGFSKPVRIHGPIDDPTVDANVAGHVGDAALTGGEVAGYLAAPFVFVPIRVASFLRPQLEEEENGQSPCLIDGEDETDDEAEMAQPTN